VIVIRLVANVNALVAGCVGGGLEVLGQELALFVEVVAGALVVI
jgi:hypothetical protein